MQTQHKRMLLAALAVGVLYFMNTRSTAKPSNSPRTSSGIGSAGGGGGGGGGSVPAVPLPDPVFDPEGGPENADPLSPPTGPPPGPADPGGDDPTFGGGGSGGPLRGNPDLRIY